MIDNKTCLICGNKIRWNERFIRLKRNQLFEGYYGKYDIWTCLKKEYICEECIEKIRTFCTK